MKFLKKRIVIILFIYLFCKFDTSEVFFSYFLKKTGQSMAKQTNEANWLK